MEADSIVELHLIRSMRAAVELLEEVLKSWIIESERGSPDWKIPEVGWRKIKGFEFQEALRSREVLERMNRKRSSLLCPDFDIHVSSFTRLGTDCECGELTRTVYERGDLPRTFCF